MSEFRLHLVAEGDKARRIYATLERIFEDDGFALAMTELDEARDLHEVAVYVGQAERADAETALRGAVDAVDPSIAVEVETLPDTDWVALSLEGLKPVRAGRFFVHGAHDRDLRPAGGIPIEIEAGLAFGTGHHGTTAGCLEMLERILTRERRTRPLDLGTGSGVLAIAIARMARIPVLATDIDPVASEVARQNCRLNEVSGLVRTIVSAGFEHPELRRCAPFDLIVANVLARPLMQLAPRMAAHIAPGGSLVLSGILDSQRRAVLAAYVGQRFRHVATIHREGWSTLHLKR